MNDTNDFAKVLIGAAGGVILALIFVGIFRNATGYGMMAGGMMSGGMMGGLFGALFALLLWAALAAVLVAALVYIVTTLRHR